MWLAHALTLSRIPIALAVVAAYGDPARCVAWIVAAAATDAADGNVARWMQRRGHTRPDIGGWLDPLVDKLFVAIALAAIWYHTRALDVIALIGARELVLVPVAIAYLARRRPVRDLHADWLGKLATIAQFAALAVALALPARALVAAAVAGALGVAAAVHYAARFTRMQR